MRALLLVVQGFLAINAIVGFVGSTPSLRQEDHPRSYSMAI